MPGRRSKMLIGRGKGRYMKMSRGPPLYVCEYPQGFFLFSPIFSDFFLIFGKFLTDRGTLCPRLPPATLLVLKFHFCIYMSVRPEGPKIIENRTAVKSGQRNDLLFNLRLLELKFYQILSLRTELFPDFEALKCRFSKSLCFPVAVGS